MATNTGWIKDLTDRLDKRPLSILLALAIGAVVYLAMAYRQEVAAHLEDVKTGDREKLELLKETVTAQQKVLELTETTNYLRRKERDSARY